MYLVHIIIMDIDYIGKDTFGKISDETLKSYNYDLNSYLDYIKNRYHAEDEKDIIALLSNTHEADIIMYIDYCRTQLKNSDVTINRKISSIRKLYDKLYNEKFVIYNYAKNIPHIKTEARSTDIFTVEELKKLLISVNGRNKYRDIGIIMMFVFCLASVNDVCSMKCCDINGNYLYLYKNGILYRKCFLNEALKSILSRFIFQERNLGQENIFLSQKNIPLNKRTVHQIIVKHLTNAGLYTKGMTSEILRKTGVNFLNIYGKVDISLIESYMGLAAKTTGYRGFNQYTEIDDNVFNNVPLANISIK